MNVSFGPESGSAPAPVVEIKQQNETPVAGVTVESTTSIAVQAPSGAIAPRGLVLGDTLPDFKDIIFPRVNLVHNTGDLKDTFQPGSIVYNAQDGGGTVLYTPPVVEKTTGKVIKEGTPPVVMVILGFRPTRYVEKVSGGARGLIVDTEEQVAANGGTTDWNVAKAKKASGIRHFEPLKEAVVAIRRPEHCKDDKSVFVYDVDGHRYALGLWGMKGSAYTVAKKAFFTPRAMGLLQEGGYPSYVFAISTFLKPFATGNTSWVPVCIPTVKTSDAVLAFVKTVLTGN